jgi:hypothetical protein
MHASRCMHVHSTPRLPAGSRTMDQGDSCNEQAASALCISQHIQPRLGLLNIKLEGPEGSTVGLNQ